jgi:hypothetical protein
MVLSETPAPIAIQSAGRLIRDDRRTAVGILCTMRRDEMMGGRSDTQKRYTTFKGDKLLVIIYIAVPTC